MKEKHVPNSKWIKEIEQGIKLWNSWDLRIVGITRDKSKNQISINFVENTPTEQPKGNA